MKAYASGVSSSSAPVTLAFAGDGIRVKVFGMAA